MLMHAIDETEDEALSGLPPTPPIVIRKASSEESVGHSYGQMAPGSSARVPANPPLDGGAPFFFVASCLFEGFRLLLTI